MYKKQIFFDIIFILILGLIPLLWFKSGYVILGHDSGLPLNPIIHFTDRLYVWTQRFGIGSDQSYALLGAFLIHGFEALLDLIGLSLQTAQKIQFIFWFTLPGFTMYFMTYRIWPGKRYLPLTASIIYMINYYLIQAWFIAERTKFSIYIALPIIVYFIISYLTKKEPFIKSVLISGVILSLMNGGGSFPLYGGLFTAILLIYAYINFIYFSLVTLKKTILFSVGLVFIYILLNSYWLLVYFQYVTSFYTRDLSLAGGADGVLTWVKYLSKGSNFFNLIRMQGVPEWYLNEFHPYASLILNNIFFQVISFIFPLLAFGSVIFVKQKKDKFYIYLFIILALIGIFLSSGTNSIFGFVFEIFIRYVPGFAMFRSAYYKFDYIQIFSYSILIGFSIDFLLSKLNKKIKFININLQKIAFLIFVGFYVIYHYPITNGMFFDFNNNPKGKISTRVSVPSYIFDFEKWVNSQNQDIRFLVFPELNNSSYISYKWGFWSLAPLNSLFARASFVQNTGLMPNESKIIMHEMYKSFLNEDFNTFFEYVRFFGIDRIIVQKDYDWDNSDWGTVNPEKYDEILKTNKNFKLEKVFGKWKIYKIINSKAGSRVFISNSINFLNGNLSDIFSFPDFTQNIPLYISGTGNDSLYADKAYNIYVSSMCIGCDLKKPDFGFEVYNPKLLPGSLLYDFVVRKKEVLLEKSINDFLSKVNFYMTTSDRRIIEIKWMVEFRQNLEEMQRTLEMHNNLLNNLSRTLALKDWKISSIQSEEIVKQIIGHMLTQASLISSVHNDDSLTLENRLTLASSYEKILEIIRTIKDKAWFTDSPTEKKYVLSLPKRGKYDIYIKKNTFANPTKDISKSFIEIKENKLRYFPIKEVNGWVYYGSVDAVNDVLHMNVLDSTISNLIINLPLFEQGNGFIFNGNSVVMSGDSASKCVSYKFSNIEVDKEKKYIMSFDYRNFNNNKTLSVSVDKQRRTDASLRTKETLLQSRQNWTHFETSFIPVSKDGYLNFCNGFISVNEQQGPAPWLNYGATNHGEISPLRDDSERQIPVTEINNISMYEVSSPIIVLHKRNSHVNVLNKSLNYIKKNPVEYILNTKNFTTPLYITLRESYNKYWEVCSVKNNCLPSNDNDHFANAGIFNTWFIDKNLSGEMHIIFKTQKTFILGCVITVFSYILILGYCFLMYIFKRKDRK